MITVGITGGIGSGKTTICNIFRQLGVPVYEADSEAKLLYSKEPSLAEKIRKEISEEVFKKKGKQDKKKLAELIFRDRVALEKLNAIVHPLVQKHFSEWKKKNEKANYILKEAAILFESGSY